jgi:hypothetical protein
VEDSSRKNRLVWPRLIAGGLAATVVVGAALIGSARGDAEVRGPFSLVSLASLGTVTWSCGNAPGSYGLGFRPAPGQTTRVAIRAGDRPAVARSVTDEALPAVASTARHQEVRIAQKTGAGTLSATVLVDFRARSVAPFCLAYLPPRVTVTMGPRR